MTKVFLLVLFICSFLMFHPADAASSGTILVEWDPPTHYAVENACSDVSEPIVAADIPLLRYVVQYRLKSATSWSEVETTDTSVSISDLGYEQTYEIQVGAYFLGGNTLCFIGPIEKVSTSKPSPGNCSNLR